MNDDLAAWEALRDEYHARLANNYMTSPIVHVMGLPARPSGECGGGGLNPAGMFFDNVVLAVKSGCPISRASAIRRRSVVRFRTDLMV